MEINEELFERKLKDSVVFGRLIRFTVPFIWYFIVGILIVLIVIPISLYNPILIKEITDTLTEKIVDYDLIFMNVLLMAIIVIIKGFSIYFMFYILQKAGQKINCHIREKVFSHIEYYSINQFNNIPVGKLVTRVTNDINNITDLYSNIIIGFIRNILTAIFSLCFMFYLNKTITLWILVTIPFLIIGTIIFRRVSRKAYRESRTNNTEVNAFLSEHLSGVKITQIFNREELENLKFKNKTKKLLKSNMKTMRSFAYFRPYIFILSNIALAIVLYLGGIDIITGTLTIGTLIAFYDYLYSFYDPLQQISEQFDTLQSAFASAEKIFSILDTKPEIVDEIDAEEVIDFVGDIEFKNVWFAYKAEDWILKDVSFKVNANETVAFVGETGSGKTTILSLITRNYNIQKGQILIGGRDIKSIKLDSLRGAISQMLQDVFLFSGTIESNIKLRENEKFTDEEMVEAAKYVNADKFISKLPKTYQEEVLERGNNFSAGQRQLLSFARAILHKPKIIILDEATANIDTETEKLIQNSLEKMMNIGTMLIVAHRLSTIQNADKIIVLSKGEIIESGNHTELLKKQGHYYNLYLLQFANDEGLA